MRFCSAQIFHDNVVAHEKGLQELLNVDGFKTAICWDYYSRKENWASLLQSTWIRPEDIHHYEDLFGCIKLATRMTERPVSVIKAYVKEEYRGNLLDLFEPNHTLLLNGYYIDNSSFPDHWFEKTSACDGECHECDYCSDVLAKVLVRMPNVSFF